MAIPDEEETSATPTVASTNGTTASTMTTGSLATLSATAADTTAVAENPLTVLAADTTATGSAVITEGQTETGEATSFYLYATSALHGVDPEEYASGVQQNLTSIENLVAGTQQSYSEPRESPVEEASASVVPTSLIAFPAPNRIRDVSSGITARVERSRLSSSSLSSDSEDYESSSSEEGAIGGVTKRNGRSLEKKSSKAQLSSGTSVDVSSVRCSICMVRILDSVCCPCGHSGCYPCIGEWLLLGKGCHMCRQHVTSVETPVKLCSVSGETYFTN